VQCGGKAYSKAPCVLRTCGVCKPATATPKSAAEFVPKSKLFLCPTHTGPTATAEVNYKVVVSEDKTVLTKDEDGHIVETKTSHLVKQQVSSTLDELSTAVAKHYFYGGTSSYVAHRHCATCNAGTFDAMVDKLRSMPGHIIMLMDFGMNYSHVHKDESQGEFWCHVQSTVLPIIVYRLVDGVVWAESHVYISDDNKHDNDFVRHCVGHLTQNLIAEGVDVDHIHFWSDGCAAQFKLAKQMYFVSQTSVDLPNGSTHDVIMSHFFFCSCHGKGPSDAETAVVKTAGRTAERFDIYLAYPVDFYNEVKLKLEGVLAPDAKDKQRHTLRRRVIQFVEQGAALRVTTTFTGLEGHIACNHSFRGVSRLGEVKVRWLPCSCDGCFSTVLGPCTQTEVNTDEVKCTVLKKSTTDTRTSDERLQERASKLARTMSNTRGGCKGGLCAAFVDAAEDEPQWDLLEIDGAPRALHKDDIIDGKKVGRGSQKPQDIVVRAFRFGALPDPEPNKKRRFFEDPPAEKCERDIHECTAGPGSTCCGKWHSEVIFALALRPPFLAPESRVRSFKKAKRGGHPTSLQLATGICQSIDAACRGDEAVVRATTRGGNLPVTK